MRRRIRRAVVFFAIVDLIAVAAFAAERDAAGQSTDRLIRVERLLQSDVVATIGPELPPVHHISGRRPADRSKVTRLEDRIDQCVQTNRARLNAPGAAVAVMLDGEVIYEQGYGVKRRGGSDPVNPATVFRIGSVTKMMTAAAVMQQVELGRVDLDAPVTDYIPELVLGGRWPADRITVRHTLTHTTGFPDFINDAVTAGDQALSLWAADQSDVALQAPPGSYWNYSNPNFMLAGLVAERAAGVPYRDLYRESLWEPAGMTSTTFNPASVIVWGNYSWGHYYDQDTAHEYVVSPNDNDLWAAGPAGLAFSTVEDLVQWALLLMDGGGPVLSPWSAATMQDRHQWMHYTPDLYYGYGVMIEEYHGLDVRQHGGNVAGYGTYLLWVPDRRFAVALLTNVTSSLSDAAYCIVDEVLEPEPVDEPDLSTDPSTWRRYLGDYVVTDYEGVSTEATVYFDGDRLMARILDPEQPWLTVTTPLEQLYLDTFLFDSNGDGNVDNDITFCGTRGQPGIIMWARNRLAVGVRQLTPRASERVAAP